MTEQELNNLVENNLKLVHYCANRFRGRGIEYDDLFSAGCLGLVKAANGFDEKRGLAFSTYAVPTIFGEIKRLFRDGSSVRISRRIKELYARCRDFSSDFFSKHGREPTVEEISLGVGASAEDVSEAINVSSAPLSLSPDEEGRAIDVPEEAKDNEIADRLSLEQVMNTLEDEDRRLIELRFLQRKTQTETAKIMNMTQVSVSRREKKILLFMRKQLE